MSVNGDLTALPCGSGVGGGCRPLLLDAEIANPGFRARRVTGINSTWRVGLWPSEAPRLALKGRLIADSCLRETLAQCSRMGRS